MKVLAALALSFACLGALRTTSDPYPGTAGARLAMPRDTYPDFRSSCWLLRDAGEWDWFWAGTVRLDTAPAMYDVFNEGYQHLTTLSSPPPGVPADTQSMMDGWLSNGRDSLILARSYGMSGTKIHLLVRGDSADGVMVSFADMPDPGHPSPRRSVTARRVSCGTRQLPDAG
jgi:hypothetical protein